MIQTNSKKLKTVKQCSLIEKKYRLGYHLLMAN